MDNEQNTQQQATQQNNQPGGAAQPGQPTAASAGANASAQASIDYARIQQMLDGTLAAKEDTALKAYFRQQGLSQAEAEQAMAAFKQQKAANQPDVPALQSELQQARAAAQKSMVDSAATMAAVALGIDAKTIPYVLKMADLSQVVGTDGKINDETLKNALNKVLEDVPALKPQAGASGFQKVGTGASGAGTDKATDDELKRAFGLM